MTVPFAFVSQALQTQPSWFYGAVAVMELLGLITAFAISYFGWKAYSLFKDKRFLYFFIGFAFIGLNLLAHSILNIAINFDFLDFILKNKNAFILSLFFFYYLFILAILLAYASFIIMYSKLDKAAIIILIYVLTLTVGTFYFTSYPKFNIAASVLLAFVVYYTGRNYVQQKTTNSLLVFSAFVLILLSHLLVIMELFIRTFYIFRYVFELAGFICLLVMFLRVMYGGKKK